MENDNRSLEELSPPRIGSYWKDNRAPQFTMRVTGTFDANSGIMIELYDLDNDIYVETQMENLYKFCTLLLNDEV